MADNPTPSGLLPIHYMHDLDRMPLCWSLADVEMKSASGISQTNDEKKVTCSECRLCLEEL